jgi:DNA-binding transcriptional regulator YiaG
MINESPKANEVKEARIRARLNQREASQLIYTSVNTWNRWETGKYEMPLCEWHLFTLLTNEVNKVNLSPKDNATNELKSIVDDWTEHNPYD